MSDAEHPAGSPITSEVRIGVFAEAPLPGRCSSKLLAAHAPEWATGLYASMLRDTLDGLLSIDAREYVVFGPDDDEGSAALARHVPAPWQIARGIETVAGAVTRLEADRAIAILARSDAPSAAIDPLAQVLASVGTGAFAVLGPADHGDAWLVGIARAAALIGRDLPWTGPEVAATMRVRCTRAGIELHELPPATIVDEPSAVLTLLEELRRHPERAPRTAHYVVSRG